MPTTTGSPGAHFIFLPQTGDGGGGEFSGVHNDLAGRSATNAHPATAVSADTTDFVNSDADNVQDVLADLDAAITDAPTQYKQIVHVASDNSVSTVDVSVGDTLVFVDGPVTPTQRAAILLSGGDPGTRVTVKSLNADDPPAWSIAWDDNGTPTGIDGGTIGFAEFGSGTHAHEDSSAYEFRYAEVVKSDDGTGWYFVNLPRTEDDIPHDRVSGGYMEANDIDVPDLHEMLDQVDLALNTLAGGTLGPNAGYSTDVGNGTDNIITVTHNLGTKDVVVSVRDPDDNEVLVDNEADTLNTVVLTFDGDPPTLNEYRVTVLADGDPVGYGSTIPAAVGMWHIPGTIATQAGLFPAVVPYDHTITHMTVGTIDPTGTGGVDLSLERNETTAVFSGVNVAASAKVGSFDSGDGSNLDGDAGDYYVPSIDSVGSGAGTNYTITLWAVPRA